MHQLVFLYSRLCCEGSLVVWKVKKYRLESFALSQDCLSFSFNWVGKTGNVSADKMSWWALSSLFSPLKRICGVSLKLSHICLIRVLYFNLIKR